MWSSEASDPERLAKVLVLPYRRSSGILAKRAAEEGAVNQDARFQSNHFAKNVLSLSQPKPQPEDESVRERLVLSLPMFLSLAERWLERMEEEAWTS